MCDCAKNQTHDEVFAWIKDKQLKTRSEPDADLGFGLFLVPAPAKGILEYETVIVPDLTYRETVKRGDNCVAFQWIPKGMVPSTTKAMINTVADLEAMRLNCNDSCRGGCPMNGCFCYQGEVQCHR